MCECIEMPSSELQPGDIYHHYGLHQDDSMYVVLVTHASWEDSSSELVTLCHRVRDDGQWDHLQYTPSSMMVWRVPHV